MTGNAKSWRTRGLAVLVAAVLAALAGQTFKPTGLGQGFASGNGRIEATIGAVFLIFISRLLRKA